MAKRKSNNSNRTARRHEKAKHGLKAGKSAMGSAARRPGNSAKVRAKDKKPSARNKGILRTRKTSTLNTQSTS